MASRYSGQLSQKLQEQLDYEIANTQSPVIYFRQIPGSRRYYNPATGNEVSEHLVLRYRATLPMAARESIRTTGRRVGLANHRLKLSMANTYALRVRGLTCQPFTAEDAWNDPVFNFYVARMYDTKYQVFRETKALQDRLVAMGGQRLPFDILQQTFSGALEPFTGPDSDYAQALVELGRRLPTETVNVGMSPLGYIDNNTIPFYERMIEGCDEAL